VHDTYYGEPNHKHGNADAQPKPSDERGQRQHDDDQYRHAGFHVAWSAHLLRVPLSSHAREFIAGIQNRIVEVSCG
jgi:hypothetical protein